eukprot:Seg2375.5 transcript_id=Seg2375.5/GoldUCD/mRNA.D3Y31 product="hypothetical protein" protein_id=Seg2375.5/GoldUCD/D3Y31
MAYCKSFSLFVLIAMANADFYQYGNNIDQKEAEVYEVYEDQRETKRTTKRPYCEFSEEAKKSKFINFLNKVQDTFYELHPFLIGTLPNVDQARIKRTFKPFDATPARRKERTDGAKTLLTELKALKISDSKLKTREARGLASLQYFLNHNFDFPLEHYYEGTWMLGPDYLCNHIGCDIGTHLKTMLRRFEPTSFEDVQLAEKWIMSFRDTFDQLKSNLVLGVAAGMVQPREVCLASIDALEQAYPMLLEDGPKGILDEFVGWMVVDGSFLRNVEASAEKKWKETYGISMKQSLQEAMVKGFGKPWQEYVDYLKNDHIKHCVTSKIASGLSMLPLGNIYNEGKKDASNLTTGKLPTGEPLDGKKIYEQIIHYYTTTELPVEEIYKKGKKVLDDYYPKMKKLAKEIANVSDTKSAIKKFKEIATSPQEYFNDGPFPKNETGAEAQRKCSSERTARLNCPERWKALQKWFKFSRDVMQRINSMLPDLFFYSGEKRSVPSCPVKLVPDFNPSAGVPSYIEGDEDCIEPGKYFIPFFNEKSGPKHEDTTTNGHEARPGHHLQSQGYLENFADPCEDVITWLDDMVSHNTGFAEGWGLYAENPLLPIDLNLYKDNKMELFGMVKWQLWRALRVLVDIGLHYKNMTRDEALGLFAKYAWDSTDMVKKEITRYQGTPGQATTYLVGQQVIVDARKNLESKLGDKFRCDKIHFIYHEGHATYRS